MPLLIALGHGKRPVEQVSDVRQNLCGSARTAGDAELRKIRGRTAQSFASAIGQSCERVTQQFAFVIRGRIVRRCCHIHAAPKKGSRLLVMCRRLKPARNEDNRLVGTTKVVP